MASIHDVDAGTERLVAPQQEFDPKLYLDILRRRYLHLAIPAVILFSIVFVIARTLPPVFLARATILVESQQIPSGLAQSTVTANAAERIQIIQQRLMTRDNLLSIARKYGLFGGMSLSPTEMVERMRDATKIQQIDIGRSARPDTQALGFTVGFEYDDAGVASNVANEFVTSILQQNIQSRTTRAAETKKFFEQRVAQLDKDLVALEARIVEFKKVNEGALPETLIERRALLAQLQGSIADIDRRIAFANDPKLVEPEKEQLDNLNRQLAAKKRELEFSKEELESLKRLAEKGVVPQNRVRDTERANSALELDIEALESNIANKSSAREREFLLQQLKDERADLAKRVIGLNEGILKTPQVESELIALTRAYDNMQQEYRDAKTKASEAAIGEQLEEDRQAERFEVIEQATAPDEPVRPNRKQIIFVGAIGGIAGGVGFVMLLEMLDRSIRSGADLERRLGLRPLATIPYITTPQERRRRWTLVLIFAVVAVALVLAALVLVQLFYLPLDLVAEKLLRRIGF